MHRIVYSRSKWYVVNDQQRKLEWVFYFIYNLGPFGTTKQKSIRNGQCRNADDRMLIFQLPSMCIVYCFVARGTVTFTIIQVIHHRMPAHIWRLSWTIPIIQSNSRTVSECIHFRLGSRSSESLFDTFLLTEMGHIWNTKHKSIFRRHENKNLLKSNVSRISLESSRLINMSLHNYFISKCQGSSDYIATLKNPSPWKWKCILIIHTFGIARAWKEKACFCNDVFQTSSSEIGLIFLIVFPNILRLLLWCFADWENDMAKKFT